MPGVLLPPAPFWISYHGRSLSPFKRMSNGQCWGVVGFDPPWFKRLQVEPFKGHCMSEDASRKEPMSPLGRRRWSEKETPPKKRSPTLYDFDGLLSTSEWVKIKTSVTLPVLPSTANNFRNLEWQDHAVCLGNTDLFFEHRCSIRCSRHRHGCERLECVREAKALCASCPVLEHCRIWAIETHLQHGIAGAMTERERLNIRRQGL